jgi:cytosine/adenosine deaminase-related metal-dependent hydrolase
MISQEVKHCRTFVDADDIVGSLPIDTAVKLKSDYSDKIDLQIAIQPLEGVIETKARRAFISACEKADVIGGLPDRDNNPEAHVDIIFDLARELGKPVDVHVDQNNSPYERETRMVSDKIEKYGLEGRVRLVHGISLSCQEDTYREDVYRQLKNTGTTIIVCPSAGLSMKQKSNLYAPIHNSLAPVRELVEAGVDVALGVDNIHDLFMPLVDGDLWFESRLLMEAVRCYDLDLISDIVTNSKGFSW